MTTYSINEQPTGRQSVDLFRARKVLLKSLAWLMDLMVDGMCPWVKNASPIPSPGWMS